MDRDAIRAAAESLRRRKFGTVYAGGHSYGGRQASILAAEESDVAAALLLLSYPLHPPRKPEQLRTAHFGTLRTPLLFVHGTKDPFGSPDELRAAVPPHAELLLIEGAGHELKPVVANPAAVAGAFLSHVSREGG